MKTYYEFLGIIPGSLAETEIEPVIKRITDFFTSQNAELNYHEYLGRKRLAFPIKHLRHGYYFLLEINLEAQKLDEIERKLKLEESLLRYLIITSQPKSREEREKEKMRRQSQLEKKERKEKRVETGRVQSHKDQGKISLDELDKKLDEILEEKI